MVVSYIHARVGINVDVQIMFILTYSALISSNIQLSGKKVLTSTLVVDSVVMSVRIAVSSVTVPPGTNINMRPDH